MYKEHFEVGKETEEKILCAKKTGKRVIAVGTTVVRALETAARGIGTIKAKKGWKQLAVVIAIIVVLFLAVIFLLNADLLASVIAAIIALLLLAVFFRKAISNSVSGKNF